MARGRSPRAVATGLASLGALAVAVVAVAQALLPGLAASRVRKRLERYGTVRTVTVRAFPAIELLWGDVDSVTIHADHLELSQQELAALTSQAGQPQNLDLTAGRLSLSGLPLARAPLSLSDVEVSQRQHRLRVRAVISREALARVLPEGIAVTVEDDGARGSAASGDRGVTLRVSGALFGMRAGLRVGLAPVDGALVARPEGIVGGLIAVTVFSDRQLEIDSIRARQSEQPGGGYLVELGGRIRDS